jgi:hypothetical protein
MRILITGASGSGTSTLGAALATQLSGRLLEADDFLWLPSEPPYQRQRPQAERSAGLVAALAVEPVAVVSGAVGGWGAEIEDAFDLVVFLYVDTAIRLERLRRREMQRFGRVNPAFLAWAAAYDAGPTEGRGLARQEAWLACRRCAVLRLVGELSTAAQLARIRAWMEARQQDQAAGPESR